MTHSILQLQSDYLQTGSEQVLSQFYIEVLKYTKHILKVSQQGDRAEDAYDLASKLAERLMINREPVIKTTPSGYLNAALRFMGKPHAEVGLYDWMESKLSTTDFDGIEYQEMVDEIMNALWIPDRVKAAVEMCLRSSEAATACRETVAEEDRKIFDLCMEQVKKYVQGRQRCQH